MYQRTTPVRRSSSEDGNKPKQSQKQTQFYPALVRHLCDGIGLVNLPRQRYIDGIMKAFSIDTLGCKVNQYESQQIREFLERLGLDCVPTSDSPDLVVVNTCCVTRTASAKSRQYIRKAQRLNPDAAIVISGCLPTVRLDELNGMSKNACIIEERSTTAEVLSRIVMGLPANSDPDSKAAPPCELPALTSFKGHTRTFLKIQDGCDGLCSYCIVPKTRPALYSKPPEQALSEARALVEAGHREIVVTGICLGAYGHETARKKNRLDAQNDKLAELLDKMADLPNLARIRLSSLEPADVTPRLLDTFRAHTNIMPHLHLSLQSGSDAILKRMCRQYTVSEFRDRVDSIKSMLDRPAITTDIIVGFPGETDSDFEQTVDLAKYVGFAKMHVFSFSPRKGTSAAKMRDRVDNKVINKRAQILHNLDIELGLKYRRQFIGETATILLESCNHRPHGRSERYFMVYLEKTPDALKKNELVKVKLVENNKDGAVAIIRPHPGPER